MLLFNWPATAPNIFQFRNKSVRAEYNISGATATHHSFFTLFHSRPAYERNPLIRSGYNLGSVALKLLKTSGYKLYGFGHPPYLYKMSGTASDADTVSEDSNNQIIFGAASYLEDGGTLKSDNYGSGSATRDYSTVQALITAINNSGPAAIDLSTNKNFVFLYLYSTHTPFSWLNDITKVDNPYYDFSKNVFFESIKDPNDDLILKLKNSYRNAVRGIDKRVGEVLNELKRLNKYDDSIIIFVGDHGALLYENTYMTHGRTSRQETSSIPLYYKFADRNSSDDTFFYKGSTPKLSALMDVFPTIIDYLGLESTSVNQFFDGESILSHSNYGAISVKPNGEADTPNVAFYTDHYKVLGEFTCNPNNYGEILNTSSFVIKDVRDFKDQHIDLGETLEGTKETILKDFEKLFQKIFNNYG